MAQLQEKKEKKEELKEERKRIQNENVAKKEKAKQDEKKKADKVFHEFFICMCVLNWVENQHTLYLLFMLKLSGRFLIKIYENS